MRRSLLATVAAGFAWLSSVHAVRADGAFPDELQVFAPLEFPHRVVLGTNFGLLISDDDGAHFDFVCEAHVSSPNDLVINYFAGPGGELYAIYGTRVGRSADEGCTWSASTGGTDSSRGISDAFADPTDGGRVAALAIGPIGGPVSQLFVSTDRGATFGTSIDDEASATLIGVEYATSEPGTLYVTGADLPSDAGSRLPFVRALVDGGWRQHLQPSFVGDLPYLAAVDPANPSELYLRIVTPSASDDLAISTDRGATLGVALDLGETMSAFALGGDGTVYVGTRSGSIWVRSAGSMLFVKGPSPRLRCLAERSGTVYGCGDNAADGYALGVSTDQGASFEPLLRYNDIRGLLACPGVEADCAAALAAIRIQFPPELSDGGPVDGGGVGLADGGPGSTPRSGCGCATASWDISWLPLLAVGLRRRWRSA